MQEKENQSKVKSSQSDCWYWIPKRSVIQRFFLSNPGWKKQKEKKFYQFSWFLWNLK